MENPIEYAHEPRDNSIRQLRSGDQISIWNGHLTGIVDACKLFFNHVHAPFWQISLICAGDMPSTRHHVTVNREDFIWID